MSDARAEPETYILTRSSLNALISRVRFHEAKNTFWSGNLLAIARWKGCARSYIRTATPQMLAERTLMPHSGTKSRLLNTTTRSLTGPLVGPDAGESGEESVDPVAPPCLRSRRHFWSAPVRNNQLAMSGEVEGAIEASMSQCQSTAFRRADKKGTWDHNVIATGCHGLQHRDSIVGRSAIPARPTDRQRIRQA